MKIRPRSWCAFSLVASFLLTGCQVPQSQPTQPQTASISCKLPVVTALPETKEAQEKGGVEIAIVPAIYKSVRKTKTSTRQIEPPIGVVLFASGNQNKVYVEQTTTPYLEPLPARLQFTVRVNNKLARVFRGQGSVVQFNVGGKLIPFDKVDYKEFLNGIVPPRNETEFTIYGPTLDFLPEKGTIGIFLYDVVTATDTAGAVTDKQNYEWYFTYTTQMAEESAEVKTKQGFLDVLEFQQEMMREQGRAQ